MKFKEIIKNKEILKALEEKNYENPTPIQEKMIPLILDGFDVLGESQTGTGKTLAFSLPILEKIEENHILQTLILAPTRELAIQIERDIEAISTYQNIHVTCVYGSSSIEEQIKNIKKGCEIVVGTPGRVKDLIKRKVLKLTEIKFFVLDEADEMLSMGFQEELEFIFKQIHNDRQVLLFSATMPNQILKIAKNYMSNEYKHVSVITDNQTSKNVTQEYYVINQKEKTESLCRIVDYYTPQKCIIFCKTKKNADELLEKLTSKHYRADIIHGDIMQGQRIATLDRFKAGVFNYLIATDVAARGIHVNDIDIVINYNLPENKEAYVHRIGRTGRVNKTGLALTLINEKEEAIIKQFEKEIKTNIVKKELPNEKNITENQVERIIQNIDKNALETSPFHAYLENLDQTSLKELANSLLLDKLMQSIGSDFNINVKLEPKKKKKKRELNDSTRVFLTIGKLDKIEKRDFLCFLEHTANVKEGTFTGMEILSKFTFVNVNNKHLDTVLKKCNNIKYNNRLIRIEKAK